MKKFTKYQLNCNLSEKQIEADVACYLGWITPLTSNSVFRLKDVDEKVTGADKLFDSGNLIYLQFKKSSGLKSIAEVAVSNRKNQSALEDIRQFRATNNFADDPTLYFQLRSMAKNAVDFQHNILKSYDKPPISHAVYVAPLTLDYNEYEKKLFDSSCRFREYPFYYRLQNSIFEKTQISLMKSIPFLRAHVSIKPHSIVQTHEHYYSYSTTAEEICWHSPMLVTKGPSRLSDFLSAIFEECIYSPDNLFPLDVLVKHAEEMSAPFRLEGDQFFGETALDRLQSHGRWLQKNFDIRQVLLLRRQLNEEDFF